jgi:hypothetical protein
MGLDVSVIRRLACLEVVAAVSNLIWAFLLVGWVLGWWR